MAMTTERDICTQLHLDGLAYVYPVAEERKIDQNFRLDGVWYSFDAVEEALNRADAALLQAFLEYPGRIHWDGRIRGHYGWLTPKNIVQVLFPPQYSYYE